MDVENFLWIQPSPPLQSKNSPLSMRLLQWDGLASSEFHFKWNSGLPLPQKLQWMGLRTVNFIAVGYWILLLPLNIGLSFSPVVDDVCTYFVFFLISFWFIVINDELGCTILSEQESDFFSLNVFPLSLVQIRADPWFYGGCSSVGRALDCDSSSRGFEPRQSPQKTFSLN